MRRVRSLGVIVLLTGLLAGLWPAVPSAQAVVVAQILDFWNLLSVGGTFSGVTLSYTNLSLQPLAYANWGTTLGVNGYGIRDNAGTIEVKNSGGSWVSIGGGSNGLGTYLVQTATNAPANAQVLGALATGLVFNTTATGVQSIYAGTSCTNQFPRSLNASGVATCQTVALGTDVSGTLPAADFPALTGDLTTPGASLATTLAASGVSPAVYGLTTALASITVDSKGRVTAASNIFPQFTLSSTYLSSLSAANLTNIPAANFSGTILAANFPALTGDVTNTVGTLATTVGTIGGKTVSLGGNFATSGVSAITLTSTGATNVTLPLSGTLLTNTATTLGSLVTVGTLTTGTWQATPVQVAFGGTGLATIPAHAVLVGAGTGNLTPITVAPTCVLAWISATADPTCNASPQVSRIVALTDEIVGGIFSGASTEYRKVYAINNIADGVATPVVMVFVPAAAEAASVHLRLVGSLGAGGAIGADECSATLDGALAVTRTTGLATVVTMTTATMTASSCVAGATTIAMSYAPSVISGANNASQSLTVNVTIAHGGGSSTNHSVVAYVELINANTNGVTLN